MATAIPFQKENDAESTPVSSRQLKAPATTGRSFGTPLSNSDPAIFSSSQSMSTSKKAQFVGRASSKKIVRAKRILNQHRSPIASAESSTYTVTFLPGPIGFQPAPFDGDVGCQVQSFVDVGEDTTNSEKLSQIRVGDAIVEINDENVAHKDHDEIVNKLKSLQNSFRKVRFRSSVSISASWANAITTPQSTTPKPPRKLSLNSNGSLTPMAPTTTNSQNEEIPKTIDGNKVLFLNPATVATPPVARTTPNNTSVVSTDKPPTSEPPSPEYKLLPQDSINCSQSQVDVVLDVNNASRETIDSTSTISPSQVKNMSQEDLELGLRDTIFQRSGNSNNHKPFANVFRNLNNIPVVQKVRSFDFATSLGGALSGGARDATSTSLKEEVHKKNQVLNQLTQASIAIQNDISVEDNKEDTEIEGVNSSTVSSPISMDRVKPFDEVAEDSKTDDVQFLRVQLQQARGHEMELQRKLEECQEESKSRILQISQLQITSQAELEEQLKKLLRDTTEAKENVSLLERKLHQAEAKILEVTNERDEALAAAEASSQQLHELETKAESQQSSHRDFQLQIAKLQTELRDCKKSSETMQSQLSLWENQYKESQERLQSAEASLAAKSDELEGTKCMMETYEEKFITRENEMDALAEENEFASRELAFARSENKQLKELLEHKTKSFDAATKENSSKDMEIQRLQESLTMSQRELADQKQTSYDRAQEMQAQIAQLTTDLSTTKGQLKLEIDAVTAREASLEQRDADLQALNQCIEEKNALWQKTLEDKDDALAKQLSEITSLRDEKECLVLDLSNTKSELQGTLEMLEAKGKELALAKEETAAVRQSKETLDKENKNLKASANEIYQEKCRITKEFQNTKGELSEHKIQSQKLQDNFLHRIKTMDGKAKDAQNQLKRKESELASVSGKLERANAKIDTLSSDIEHREGMMQSAFASIKSLEEKRDQLIRLEAHLKSEIDDKEKSNQTLAEECRDTRSQLSEARSQISLLQRERVEIESAHTVSKQELVTLEEEIEGLQRMIESQKETIHHTSSQLSSKSLECMALETTIDNLREERQELLEEVEAKKKSLAAIQIQYNEQNERFVQAGENASNKIKSLAADLIRSQEDLEDATKIKAKQDKQILSLLQQIQAHEDDLTNVRVELESQNKQSFDLRSQLESTKKDFEGKLSELNREIENCRMHTAQLEKECDSRSTDNAKLEMDLVAAEKKLSNARALLGVEQDKFKQELEELQQVISNQNEEMSTLSDHLHSSAMNVENLQKQLKAAETKYEHQQAILQENLKQKEERIRQLKQEKDESSALLSARLDDLNVAKLEIERLSESLKRSRDEVANLGALMDSQRQDHLTQIEDITRRHDDESERLLKEKEDVELVLGKNIENQHILQRSLERTANTLEEEREKTECLVVERDAIKQSLDRAEDLVADLRCELKILQEEQMNDSIDSIDSQTMKLSKSELRLKCKYLSEEVQEAEVRASVSTSVASQKDLRIKGLEQDTQELLAELERMVENTEQLDSALMKAKLEKATSENEVQELRENISAQQEKVEAIKKELAEKYDENSSLLDQVHDLQASHNASKDHETLLQHDLAKLKETLSVLEEAKAAAEEKNTAAQNEVTKMSEELAAAKDQETSLEFEIAKLEGRLSEAEKENQLLLETETKKEEVFEEKLQVLQNENTSLQSAIFALENERDVQEQTIQSLGAAQDELNEKLQKERESRLKIENLREEAVLELAEASRVLGAQKEMVSAKETKLLAAEQHAMKLSDEVASLKDAIQKLESESTQSGVKRASQLDEMEKARNALETEKQNAKVEADALRDEVRHASRKASELERVNKSLRSRIDDLKLNAETTKTQLREARDAWAKSENLARAQENQIQTYKADVDHLRAKAQLCGSALQRLKSERALLQEAALRGETNPASTSAALAELHSQLQTYKSRLSNTASQLRTYKKMCNDKSTTEKELVAFIENVIDRAESAFTDLSEAVSPLEDPPTPEKCMDDAKCCLNLFFRRLDQAKSELEDKRAKVNNWKSQNLTQSSTPGAKSIATVLTPNQASVNNTFRSLKRAIGNNSIDTQSPQIQSVILSLEGQIEELCQSLKQSNLALAEKEKQYAGLQQQLTTKAGRESQLSAIEEVPENEKERLQTAGVKMACKVLESKSKGEASAVLRKWSSAAASAAATEKQRHNIDALGKQLSMTRDKMVQLKSQLKK